MNCYTYARDLESAESKNKLKNPAHRFGPPIASQLEKIIALHKRGCRGREAMSCASLAEYLRAEMVLVAEKKEIVEMVTNACFAGLTSVCATLPNILDDAPVIEKGFLILTSSKEMIELDAGLEIEKLCDDTFLLCIAILALSKSKS